MTTTNGFLGGITYDPRMSREEEASRQERSDRLAATLVRKTTFRHDRHCRGTCRHRNHDRDRQHYDLLLDALGLADQPARREDYRNQLTWHAVTRSEMALMSPVRAA